MALKDILVQLDSGIRNNARLALAARLARQHGAHLTALHVIDLPRADYLYGSPMPFATVGPETIISHLWQDAAAAAIAVETHFRQVLQQQELEGEWRLVEGDTPDTVALHARYADLTILPQQNPDAPTRDRAADAVIVASLMSSGRPVLAIPYAGEFTVLGQHILVAWNASREAARAANDALPFLCLAKKVTILTINPRSGIGGHDHVPAADIALHLARHGVRAEAAHTVSKDVSDGNILLSYAADMGADMIVCGGYGHSRVREMIFGGVTRSLLQEMTVPVLLSH